MSNRKEVGCTESLPLPAAANGAAIGARSETPVQAAAERRPPGRGGGGS